MARFQARPPIWFTIVAVVLTLWNLIGCYFCYLQFRLGADAMAGVTDYDRALYATLPNWYNYCYALAVGAGAAGGLALIARALVARSLLVVSLIALVIQFGYIFATTDMIAHKGLVTGALPAVVIAVIGAFSIWFAGLATRRGWLR